MYGVEYLTFLNDQKDCKSIFLDALLSSTGFNRVESLAVVAVENAGFKSFNTVSSSNAVSFDNFDNSKSTGTKFSVNGANEAAVETKTITATTTTCRTTGKATPVIKVTFNVQVIIEDMKFTSPEIAHDSITASILSASNGGAWTGSMQAIATAR